MSKHTLKVKSFQELGSFYGLDKPKPTPLPLRLSMTIGVSAFTPINRKGDVRLTRINETTFKKRKLVVKGNSIQKGYVKATTDDNAVFIGRHAITQATIAFGLR